MTTENLTTLTFDLEKTLPTPVLSSGTCYYKHQLWIWTTLVYMIWLQTLVTCTSGMLLMLHVSNFVKTENHTVDSDCCSGQNINIKIALSLLWNYIVQSDKFSVNNVDHKFLESGHTILPNDQDFSRLKKQTFQRGHLCASRLD